MDISKDRGFHRLKSRLIASTGLAFYEDRDAALTNLIEARVTKLGLYDCTSYSMFLDQGAQGSREMDFLVDQLTVGETYFFRDQEQFAALRDTIIPDILKRNLATRQLRIWSAGCSTGAEPYSLAILLAREMAVQIAGWQVTIEATDLNPNFLAEAKAGKFREWALRCTSDEIRRACFSQEGLVWTLAPRYRECVSFHRMNLAESQFPTPWPADTLFDLIVCRNVMIYFTPEVNRRLVERFYTSLRDGGWLMVGAAESNQETYQAFRSSSEAGARCYQKIARPPVPRRGTKPHNLPRRKSKPILLPPPPVPVVVPIVVEDVEGLKRLADLGQWAVAAAYGQRLLIHDRLNPAVHFYRALVFENLGMAEETERALRQAIYLDRGFALAHYQLGLVLKKGRQFSAAAKSFDNTLKVLTGLPGRQTVSRSREVIVSDLVKLATIQLEDSRQR